MECNVGVSDRISRVVLAIILTFITLYFRKDIGNWQYLLFLIIGVALITAIIGFCFIYKLLGVNTCCNVECKANKKSVKKN